MIVKTLLICLVCSSVYAADSYNEYYMRVGYGAQRRAEYYLYSLPPPAAEIRELPPVPPPSPDWNPPRLTPAELVYKRAEIKARWERNQQERAEKGYQRYLASERAWREQITRYNAMNPPVYNYIYIPVRNDYNNYNYGYGYSNPRRIW